MPPQAIVNVRALDFMPNFVSHVPNLVIGRPLVLSVLISFSHAECSPVTIKSWPDDYRCLDQTHIQLGGRLSKEFEAFKRMQLMSLMMKASRIAIRNRYKKELADLYA